MSWWVVMWSLTRNCDTFQRILENLCEQGIMKTFGKTPCWDNLELEVKFTLLCREDGMLLSILMFLASDPWLLTIITFRHTLCFHQITTSYNWLTQTSFCASHCLMKGNWKPEGVLTVLVLWWWHFLWKCTCKLFLAIVSWPEALHGSAEYYMYVVIIRL